MLQYMEHDATPEHQRLQSDESPHSGHSIPHLFHQLNQDQEKTIFEEIERYHMSSRSSQNNASGMYKVHRPSPARTPRPGQYNPPNASMHDSGQYEDAPLANHSQSRTPRPGQINTTRHGQYETARSNVSVPMTGQRTPRPGKSQSTGNGCSVPGPERVEKHYLQRHSPVGQIPSNNRFMGMNRQEHDTVPRQDTSGIRPGKRVPLLASPSGPGQFESPSSHTVSSQINLNESNCYQQSITVALGEAKLGHVYQEKTNTNAIHNAISTRPQLESLNSAQVHQMTTKTQPLRPNKLNRKPSGPFRVPLCLPVYKAKPSGPKSSIGLTSEMLLTNDTSGCLQEEIANHLHDESTPRTVWKDVMQDVMRDAGAMTSVTTNADGTNTINNICGLIHAVVGWLEKELQHKQAHNNKGRGSRLPRRGGGENGVQDDLQYKPTCQGFLKVLRSTNALKGLMGTVSQDIAMLPPRHEVFQEHTGYETPQTGITQSINNIINSFASPSMERSQVQSVPQFSVPPRVYGPCATPTRPPPDTPDDGPDTIMCSNPQPVTFGRKAPYDDSQNNNKKERLMTFQLPSHHYNTANTNTAESTTGQEYGEDVQPSVDQVKDSPNDDREQNHFIPTDMSEKEFTVIDDIDIPLGEEVEITSASRSPSITSGSPSRPGSASSSPVLTHTRSGKVSGKGAHQGQVEFTLSGSPNTAGKTYQNTSQLESASTRPRFILVQRGIGRGEEYRSPLTVIIPKKYSPAQDKCGKEVDDRPGLFDQFQFPQQRPVTISQTYHTSIPPGQGLQSEQPNQTEQCNKPQQSSRNESINQTEQFNENRSTLPVYAHQTIKSKHPEEDMEASHHEQPDQAHQIHQESNERQQVQQSEHWQRMEQQQTHIVIQNNRSVQTATMKCDGNHNNHEMFADADEDIVSTNAPSNTITTQQGGHGSHENNVAIQIFPENTTEVVGGNWITVQPEVDTQGSYVETVATVSKTSQRFNMDLLGHTPYHETINSAEMDQNPNMHCFTTVNNAMSSFASVNTSTYSFVPVTLHQDMGPRRMGNTSCGSSYSDVSNDSRKDPMMPCMGTLPDSQMVAVKGVAQPRIQHNQTVYDYHEENGTEDILLQATKAITGGSGQSLADVYNQPMATSQAVSNTYAVLENVPVPAQYTTIGEYTATVDKMQQEAGLTQHVNVDHDGNTYFQLQSVGGGEVGETYIEQIQEMVQGDGDQGYDVELQQIINQNNIHVHDDNDESGQGITTRSGQAYRSTKVPIQVPQKEINDSDEHTNELTELERQITERDGNFLCPKCNFQTRWKANLLRHIKLHTGIRIPCEQCSRTFIDKYELRTHVESAHGEGSVCKECGKQFKSRAGLYEHIKQHNDHVRYRCDICGKSFRMKSHLEGHINSHDNNKPFGCGNCERTFCYKSSADRHYKRCLKRSEDPNQPKCKKCGETFRTRNLLKEHLVKEHTEVLYKCNVCGKSYAWEPCYKRHMRIHDASIKPKAPLFCDECGLAFASRPSLKQHIRGKHSGAKFKCHICGKSYPWWPSYKRHLRNHEL